MLMAVQLGGLALLAAVAAATSRAADWDDPWLFGALLVLAVGSDALALRATTLRISGSFAALTLAMVLLGPAPAAVIGVITMLVDAVVARPGLRIAVANLFTYACFPLLGGVLFRAFSGHAETAAEATGLVMALFVAVNFLNFALIYGYFVLADGRTWKSGFRDIYLPVLPVEIATGLLTAGLYALESGRGAGMIVMFTVVVLVFQYLLKTALEAAERGRELEARNTQLASLQVGLISTMVKTLSLRDHMTARHSAAVARYARTMAAALGLSPQDQETIHTAGLFHDIGKFIFPDSILLADRRLSDEDYEIVKRHPEVGADVIGEIDGYAEVARIVRHHHERIDGRGYPAGIIADEIPLGSRIIAVADTYDVITARDTYRTPVSTAEALAELRRSAGTQLDAHIVEVFIDLVTTHNVAFHHGTAADFEAELQLERRVQDYAAPRAAA